MSFSSVKFLSLPAGRVDVLVPRVGGHHLQPTAANFLAVQGGHRPIRRLLIAILCIAAVFAAQQVDVDEVAETAEDVFERVQRRRRVSADEKETFSDSRLHRRQRLRRWQLDGAVSRVVRLTSRSGSSCNSATRH